VPCNIIFSKHDYSFASTYYSCLPVMRKFFTDGRNPMTHDTVLSEELILFAMGEKKPSIYVGQVTALDIWKCRLVSGRGKVRVSPTDPAYNQALTVVSIAIQPIR
jgi:hypothetical protein